VRIPECDSDGVTAAQHQQHEPVGYTRTGASCHVTYLPFDVTLIIGAYITDSEC